MQRNSAPIFVPNKKDNLHCLQAATLIALRAAGVKNTWAEVDRLTHFDKRYYSWTVNAADAIALLVADTTFVSTLDYREFAKEGEAYLKRTWRQDWYQDQKLGAPAGFRANRAAAKRFLSHGVFRYVDSLRTNDLDAFLKSGHVLICTVDTAVLYPDNDVGGHAVVIYGQTPAYYLLHDPGLPPRPAVRVNKKRLLKLGGLGEFIAVPVKTVIS